MGSTKARTQLTPLTPLAIAVLGLLVERPMHPYEMHQLMVERRERRLIKLRLGSTYHTVERLVRDRQIRALGTDRTGNRPERTTYEITTQGRAALSTRLIEMLGTPAEEYPELALAVAEMHNLPQSLVVELLEHRAVLLRRVIDEHDQVIDGAVASGTPAVFIADVRYSRAMAGAQLEWLRELLGEIGAGRLPWLAELGLVTDAAPPLIPAVGTPMHPRTIVD